MQKRGSREICDGIDSVDRCPHGEVFKLSEENKGFWFLFKRSLPFVSNGMGGFDIKAIKYVFNTYDVSKPEIPILYDKALLMISVITEIRRVKEERERAIQAAKRK